MARDYRHTGLMTSAENTDLDQSFTQGCLPGPLKVLAQIGHCLQSDREPHQRAARQVRRPVGAHAGHLIGNHQTDRPPPAVAQLEQFQCVAEGVHLC
jgi:hypothetical protein